MNTEESLEIPERTHRPENMRSQKRSIACHRCHAQKIKCSGERPCSRCRKAGCATQCRYATRDRKIRVDESYLEQLIHDSEELNTIRARPSQSNEAEATNRLPSSQLSQLPHLQTPRLGENEPWFQTDGPSSTLYINEAACIAFATRVCQHLKPNDCQKLEIPQRNYTDESTLASLSHVDKPWPTLVCAQLLVKTALGHINPGFHLVLKKETMDGLLRVYQTGRFDHPVTKCRYFALFAIGQVYSTPPNASSLSTHAVPGTDYFAHALKLIHIIPERPSMAHIESILLLAYFCQFLNRFHSAYLLIGNALRLSLSLGLNYNVPRSQSLNLSPVEREHRVRIWWSIYILDRFWGSKSGFPVQIHDDDIYVDLPSSQVSEDCQEYFSESIYQTATIELARITGRITRDIYTRRNSAGTGSLLQREHDLLIQLRHWVNTLPENLRLHVDRPNSKHVVLMHLQFSYSVMTAIRPVLLYSIDYASGNNSQTEPLDEESRLMLTTLSTACIHAARFSLKLCLDEWTGGSLATFGYAFPAFLFSSALVLIISSVSPTGNRYDQTASETATEMLRILSASDNLAAKDLYDHLIRVRQCLDTSHFVNSTTGEHHTSSSNGASSEPHGSLVTQELNCDLPALEASAFTNDLAYLHTAETKDYGFATEAILQDSLMQDFLDKSTSDVGLLALPEMPNDFDTAFLCFSDTLATDPLI